jgi:hypothetical protein
MAIKQYCKEDPDVGLFAKIIEHRVEQQYWFTQQKLKNQIETIARDCDRQRRSPGVNQKSTDQVEVDTALKILLFFFDVDVAQKL